MDNIFVCCFGEPKGHYCWGHIYDELERRKRILGSIDSYQYQRTLGLKLVDAVVTRASKYYYTKAYFDFKGKWHRAIRAWHSRQSARSAGARSVLHITTLDMPGFKRPGIKEYLLIDSTWNSWRRYFIDEDGYSEKLKNDIDDLDRKSFLQADHVFTLGEYVCDDLVTHYRIPRLKCSSIGSGLGGVKPFFGPKEYSACSILFVAKTWFESKGGHLLLDAFRIAHSKCPLIRLVIVGSEEAVRHAAGIENVTVLPFVPQSDLQRIFNEASVLAMPAINEPWGMVFLEAMACRMPVLGLRRNSLPEMTLGGKFGFLVEKPDAYLVANALIEAVSNPVRLEVLGRAAQKHVLANYTWENAVDRMLSVIDRPDIIE